MVNHFLRLTVCGLGAALTSCSVFDFGGMIAASSSIESRFENSMTPEALAFYPKTITVPQGDYRFVVATDMHIKEEDWGRVGVFFETVSEDHFPFVLLLGDYLYEAGTSLERLADSIDSYKTFRVFPTIGNHEVYKDGYGKSYRSLFGPTCYAFEVVSPEARDLFIALDSANGTLGKTQFDWLEELLTQQRDGCRRCFVFTHSNFFSPPQNVDLVSTFPVQERMKLLHLFSEYGITAVFSGHSHFYDETTLRGVQYKTLDPWSKGEYCEVTCCADGTTICSFRGDQ